MSDTSIIAQGAEAILKKEGNTLIKDRIKKSYRLPLLDIKLRKQRTKKEAKILEKARKLIPVPKLMKTDKKEKIEIQFIDGLKLSESLDSLTNSIEICKTIGQQIAILHDNNIIHGDLTTSNMIYVEHKSLSHKPRDNILNSISLKSSNDINNDKSLAINHKPINNQHNQDSIRDNPSPSFKVFFIDFGLSFESSKIEDKAVDLHLIKQALEAKHFNHYKEFFNSIIEGYSTSNNSKLVLKRLEVVEKRGRYKQAG